MGVKMSYIEELRSLVGHRPLILVGVLVMIFDGQHRILLQHRTDDDSWDLPGGFLEPGETTEDTARREVREETGLVVGNLSLFEVCSGQDFFHTYPNGDQVFSVCPVYVTSDAHGKLCPDGDEGSEVRYFFTSELPNGTLRQVRAMINTLLEKERAS
jgi:ADP-ribose pyrophosphatase YjhB (NUDIX family)